MNNKKIHNGICYATIGSLWWGILGTYFFQYISYVGAIEVVIHRSFWTFIILFITTLYLKKWVIFKKIIFNKKNLLILSLSSFLIFANWATWIYAVSTDRIIDASYGYFIFPIINVFFGFLFFNEKLNKRRIFSILIVIISSIYLLLNFHSFPWVGIFVALFWSVYNLLRKKINVDTDIGLLIESLIILPFVIFILYFIFKTNNNNFSFIDPKSMFLLFLAGPMTVIPLFFYIKGLENAGLSTSGIIFFITPTSQFLLGYYYYNEPFSEEKFISFIFIWIAVFIYMRDLYENN
ncbi:MAG: protein RarD [Candidatus Pelagibacter sp.]|nr:protein RarD [Candidatus Pelagibacter sp.]